MKKTVIICILLCVLFCGCQMRTVDRMYCPPKRTEDYHSLQSAINSAMSGLEYSAPLTGDNQQLVQQADLMEKDSKECLLFAKSSTEHPLHVLIFSQQDGIYTHTATIDLVGTAFDKVEYAQLDGKPGLELVVGTQLSNEVSRSVSVYSFYGGTAEQILTADYVQYLTVDLDQDKKQELFVLRPGLTNTSYGIVELYEVEKGVVSRSVELNMSQSTANLKRILTGQLYGGVPAVYLASAVDDNTLITDIYTVVDGEFTNVARSTEADTSVQTMRNYYIYADDMDSDGVMELPSLMSMRPIDFVRDESSHYLIRWYSMTPEGFSVDKLYTYHHFLGGWYLELDEQLASSVSVIDLGNKCDFYLWDGNRAMKVLTLHTLRSPNREEQCIQEELFVLHRGESVIYAAKLDENASRFDISQELVLRSFRLIREYWNTGET